MNNFNPRENPEGVVVRGARVIIREPADDLTAREAYRLAARLIMAAEECEPTGDAGELDYDAALDRVRQIIEAIKPTY